MRDIQAWAVLPIAVLFTAVLLWTARQGQDVTEPADVSVPDFGSIEDVNLKKQTFFNFMLPKVREANRRIRTERSKLLPLLDAIESGNTLTDEEQTWLAELALYYRVKEDPLTDASARQKLRKRVQTIPASLVLAQAANESAWGTARFARNGNNYFGLWCWVRNCGMVPEKRDVEKKHEVASFDNVDTGVRYYMMTLNSHPAYQSLRDRRAAAIASGQPASGIELAEGLTRYSERGEDYVEEIQSMISYNRLHRFNQGTQPPVPTR